MDRSEDDELVEGLRAGLQLDALAEQHRRTTGAVRSRLSKMVPDPGDDGTVPGSGKRRVEWLRERLAADPAYDRRTVLDAALGPWQRRWTDAELRLVRDAWDAASRSPTSPRPSTPRSTTPSGSSSSSTSRPTSSTRPPPGLHARFRHRRAARPRPRRRNPRPRPRPRRRRRYRPRVRSRRRRRRRRRHGPRPRRRWPAGHQPTDRDPVDGRRPPGRRRPAVRRHDPDGSSSKATPADRAPPHTARDRPHGPYPGPDLPTARTPTRRPGTVAVTADRSPCARVHDAAPGRTVLSTPDGQLRAPANGRRPEEPRDARGQDRPRRPAADGPAAPCSTGEHRRRDDSPARAGHPAARTLARHQPAQPPRRALRAAAADGLLPPRLVLDAVGLAAGAVLAGEASPEDVWWAAGNGWLWSGGRPEPADEHRRHRHPWLRGPPAACDLAQYLHALVALRPLVDTRRPQVCRCGFHAASAAARQAVRALGCHAAPWTASWRHGTHALGLTGPAATAGFAAFLRDQARPWQAAMPPGHDPARWALADAPAWHAAGYAPHDAARLAALPDGHADRPGADQLAAMAALRR